MMNDLSVLMHGVVFILGCGLVGAAVLLLNGSMNALAGSAGMETRILAAAALISCLFGAAAIWFALAPLFTP